MNDELEKLKLHSPDWASENIRKLAEIFPNYVTERKMLMGDRGAIDYDQLRQNYLTISLTGHKNAIT